MGKGKGKGKGTIEVELFQAIDERVRSAQLADRLCYSSSSGASRKSRSGWPTMAM